MTDESNIGIMLAVAGLFVITFYLLRDPVGDAESAIIAAASCTGLTGATLAACQKAKAPAPKPGPITPAKPKPKPQGITAARPKGITAARPQKTQHGATGGGVGGPRTKAFECIQRGWKWRCYNNSYPPCKCEPPIGPIRPTSQAVMLVNECQRKAKLYGDRQYKLAADKLAMQYGYTGLNPGEQLRKNNAGTTRSAGYQERILREKYSNLIADLIRECHKRYLGLDVLADQNRGMVPRSSTSPGAGGIANPKAEKPLPPGVYPT